MPLDPIRARTDRPSPSRRFHSERRFILLSTNKPAAGRRRAPHGSFEIGGDVAVAGDHPAALVDGILELHKAELGASHHFQRS
jgi:hypothetical protein